MPNCVAGPACQATSPVLPAFGGVRAGKGFVLAVTRYTAICSKLASGISQAQIFVV